MTLRQERNRQGQRWARIHRQKDWAKEISCAPTWWGGAADPSELTVGECSEERWRRKSTGMERCPRNAVEPRRFPSIPRRGLYRFCIPGAGRSAAKKLVATGARRCSIGLFRTAKTEIPAHMIPTVVRRWFVAPFVLAFLLSLTLCYATRRDSPPRVNVRWSEQVTVSQRVALETAYRLVEPDYLDGRTWSYGLLDISTDNILSVAAGVARRLAGQRPPGLSG